MAEVPTGVPVKIICEDNWAKNFPAEAEPPRHSHIIFDQTDGDRYQKWIIEKFEEGFTIHNIGCTYWARTYGEVDGYSDFDPVGCKYYIQTAGDGKFKILLPNKDNVWTVRPKGPGFPKTVFLDPAEGTPNQLFSFEVIH